MALLVTESRLRLIKICRASSGLTLSSELRSTLTSELRSSLTSELRATLTSELRSTLTSELRATLTSELRSTLTSELRSTLTSKLRGSLTLAVLTPVSTALDAASVDVCRVSGTHADAGLHRSSRTLTGQLRIECSCEIL